jgi:hypothetical protein
MLELLYEQQKNKRFPKPYDLGSSSLYLKSLLLHCRLTSILLQILPVTTTQTRKFFCTPLSQPGECPLSKLYLSWLLPPNITTVPCQPEDWLLQSDFYVSIVTLVSNQLSLKPRVRQRTYLLGWFIYHIEYWLTQGPGLYSQLSAHHH